MNVNADFDRRVLVRTAGQPWQDSPQPGVQRILLDRIGEEVARATSLVRFAAGSRFPAHVHASIAPRSRAPYPEPCTTRTSRTEPSGRRWKATTTFPSHPILRAAAG